VTAIEIVLTVWLTGLTVFCFVAVAMKYALFKALVEANSHLAERQFKHSELASESRLKLDQIQGRVNELASRDAAQANYDEIFLGVQPEPEPRTQPMDTNRRRRRRKGRA